MKAQFITKHFEVDVEEEKRSAPNLPLNKEPLTLKEVPDPQPAFNQVRIKVLSCGVCHTELDEIEGRARCKLPVIPGHEVVGKVDVLGEKARRFKVGDRVGVAWIYSACGKCQQCEAGYENLCPDFMGTGCDANGGYAQLMVVPEDYAYPIPDKFDDSMAAPLLCAGAVGYRALKLTGLNPGETIGLFGFGASAHVVIQVIRHNFPTCPVYVFTRSVEHMDLAKKLGAAWAGNPTDKPPTTINRAIDFTPVAVTLRRALEVMAPGGRLVINAIRKRDKMELDYTRHLWLEKEIKSTANVTARDVEEFLPLAAEIPILPEITEFKLEEANLALRLLKQGKIQGAGVLRIS